MELECKTNQRQFSVRYQCLAAVVVNILSLGCGVTGGWPSPNILILRSDDTPLPSGKITMDEASWIASLWCVGGLIGNIIFGFATNNYGRKFPMLSISLPVIASWILILIAKNVYYLYAARLLCGIVAGGVFVIVPLFLSEIASDRIRGALGSTMVLTTNFGVLVVYTLGNYCDYYTTPKLIIVLTVLFVIFFSFFPESPTILMKCNKIPELERSLRFYQNLSNHDTVILQDEMNKLRYSLSKSNKIANVFAWSDLLRNPGRKAFIIGIGLAVLNQFCGCIAMSNYTSSIFEESGSTLSPNMSAIVVGIIQLVGSLISTNLVDRAGRKLLYVVSTIGTAVGLITLGVYMWLKSNGYEVEAYNWVPVAGFSIVVFIAAWAILSLPFVVVSETMPEQLKDFGASFCLTLIWICGFIVIKYLPFSIATIGFPGTMFIFAGVCLFSTGFVIFLVPETKGKSYAEIMNMLH